MSDSLYMCGNMMSHLGCVLSAVANWQLEKSLAGDQPQFCKLTESGAHHIVF